MKNDKIFRRPTQYDGMTPHNGNKRKRKIMVSFRVSEDEWKRIEARVYACGMNKNDYFVQSSLYQTILVKGNIRSFSHILESFEEIVEMLKEDPLLENLPIKYKEMLRTVAEILKERFRKESV